MTFRYPPNSPILLRLKRMNGALVSASFEVVAGVSAYALHRAARLVGLTVVFPGLAAVCVWAYHSSSSNITSQPTVWIGQLVLAVTMAAVLVALILGPVLGVRREAAEKAAGYTSLQGIHQVYPQVLPGTGIVIREANHEFLSASEFRSLLRERTSDGR